jgi:putative phosphoesterase
LSSATRIGLVGDTHIPEAGPDLPRTAYDALAGCDRILHCGDLHTIEVVDRLERIAPTMASRGNGDTRERRVRRPGVGDDTRVVDLLVEEIAGVRIGLIHDLAHTEYRNDEDTAELLERAFGTKVDVAVSGHTHVPMVRVLADGTMLVNPGSPTMPYGYLGCVGTLGFVDVIDGSPDVTVIDLQTGQLQLELRDRSIHAATFGPRPRNGR